MKIHLTSTYLATITYRLSFIQKELCNLNAFLRRKMAVKLKNLQC